MLRVSVFRERIGSPIFEGIWGFPYLSSPLNQLTVSVGKFSCRLFRTQYIIAGFHTSGERPFKKARKIELHNSLPGEWFHPPPYCRG